jgi:hypothetical protein
MGLISQAWTSLAPPGAINAISSGSAIRSQGRPRWSGFPRLVDVDIRKAVRARSAFAALVATDLRVRSLLRKAQDTSSPTRSSAIFGDRKVGNTPASCREALCPITSLSHHSRFCYRAAPVPGVRSISDDTFPNRLPSRLPKSTLGANRLRFPRVRTAAVIPIRS